MTDAEYWRRIGPVPRRQRGYMKDQENSGLTPKQIAEATAVPVSVVLADESHPAHAALVEMLKKLESGEICLS